MIVSVIVAAGLLAAPLTPAVPDARASAAPAPRYREYVALGDSWSAAVTLTHISTGHAPAGCLQATYNYPRQVAKALGVSVFRDATCGGATTAHLTAPQRVTRLPKILDGVNPPQFSRLTPTTDLVTLGMGGNDAGLAAAAMSCVNLLPTITVAPGVVPPRPLGAPCKAKWVTAAGDRMSRNILETAPKVAAAIDGIRRRSPHATILLVDYLAALPPVGGCYPYVQVTDLDMDWLGDKLEELNAMLAGVAKAKGVRLVDTYRTSFGHDVCRPRGVRWVEGLVPVTTDPIGLIVPFHPNRLGADHQARSVLRVLNEQSQL
ncbi:SGNH/GDSL hydrolase family protein [Thermoactinospora rubra]|uniref:SGNH/GDSL hydrolase family protein n=1 Tax=Thermoactinospora rubra TaxID=1088767 RepID=UPI001301FCAF|nr:SGNH/GDSL hydrolase family protein [Thermoactinospora rubra]